MTTSTINFHRHVQSVASDTWTITHNIGTDAPIVDVWIDVAGTITKVLPLSVTVTNTKVVTITFSSAQAGEACVA